MKLSSEVLNVVTTVNIVLWRVAPCSLLAKHQRYKGPYRLQLIRKTEAADSTKDNIFTCLHQLVRGLSPHANYTDRATAAGRRS